MNEALTPEKRQEIDAKMAPINEAIDKLAEHIAPIQTAIRAMEDHRDTILQEHGVDASYDDLEFCEDCSTFIIPGDRVFRYEEGPTFCSDCAPTFAEREQEVAEYIEALRQRGADEEEIDEYKGALAAIREKIALGRGDEREVW